MVSQLPPLGRLDGSTSLKLCLNLPLRHATELTALLDQIYDPASAQYHHYLTPDQFDARFGPTASDYDAVLAWAARKGFAVVARHPNRMLLELRAPASVVEQALQVTLLTYAHPTESRVFFAPDADPTIETGVPIAYIAGLDNYFRPHPMNLRHAPLRKTATQAPQMGSGPNGNLSGFDYRAAYAPGVTLTGAGQQVGLMEFDGFYGSDIPAYEAQAGLPHVTLQTNLLDGFNGVPGSGNSEVALDIEMAISMAPGLAKVVVFEDDTNGFPSALLQAMSTNTLIKQFSCSWDLGPMTAAQRNAMDTYYQKFAAQGQSYFTASGDYGSTNAIDMPSCADPYITAVGGTTLATDGPGGIWQSETVWNSGFGPGVAGSGGGVNTTYAIPAWQVGVNMTTNKGSTTYRNYPDVAIVADNIFIVADDGSQENTGGTSCASPLWAGLAALANQQAAAEGSASLGFLNPLIYHIGTNSSYAACFDDVTVGNNTNFNATQYLAVPGYDLCTGWGSPMGSSLILALTQTNYFQITPARGAVANGPVGGPFNVTNQVFTLTNSGKTAITWSLINTSAWLSLSVTNGSLAASAITTVTATLNPAANRLAAGIYTANLWFTNQGSGQSQLRQFGLRASQELVQDGGFEAGDFSSWNLYGAPGLYTNDFVDSSYDTSGLDYASQSGEYFACLGQIGSVAFLSQSLPTRPGQYYSLSFWQANPYAGTPNQFQAQWNTAFATNILFGETNVGSFDWTSQQFVVQAVTNTTILRFGARDDIGIFLLDTVSVQPVPAPALAAVPSTKTAFQLSWTALPGLSYQLQYETNLLQTNWLNLGSPITASANPMTTLETNGPDSHRFYRVEFVP